MFLVSSCLFLIRYLSLDSRPTQITEDDLILRSLIISANTFSSINSHRFLRVGRRHGHFLWGRRHCLTCYNQFHLWSVWKILYTHIQTCVCARTHACTHTHYLTLSSGVFNLILNAVCCLPKSNQLLKDLRSNGITNNEKPYQSSINRDEKCFADIAKAGQKKRYALKSVLRYG